MEADPHVANHKFACAGGAKYCCSSYSKNYSDCVWGWVFFLEFAKMTATRLRKDQNVVRKAGRLSSEL